MALPAIVAEEGIADQLVSEIVRLCKLQKIGPAYDKETKLGPVVTAEHKKFVTGWIDKGVEEGAQLVLDGRNCVVEGREKGFYVGHTVFDHVTPEMTIGDRRYSARCCASSAARTLKRALLS